MASMDNQEEFGFLGLQHLVALFLILFLGILVSIAGRRLDERKKLLLGRVLGILLIGYALVTYLRQAAGAGLHPSYSLPMQLCDWVAIACVAALMRPNALSAEIAYFWGAAGTLQAVLTPDIALGFPSWRFIQFFWGHGAALLGIVHIIAAQNFRPRPQSTLRMMIALNLYGLLALILDVQFGWNYGYLMHKPAGPSLLDYLGPWPWYLVSIEIMGLVSFWVLGLPWRLGETARMPIRRRLD